MKLYLIQHAKAKSKEEDPDRPLSDQGQADIRKVAAYVAQNAPMQVRRIFHSGKTRARQTAEALAEALHSAGEIGATSDLKAMADPSDWAKRLAETDQETMLVGHKPYMPKLAGLLLCQDEEKEVVDFQKGGVVCLGRDSDNQWAVQWIVTPEIVKSG